MRLGLVLDTRNPPYRLREISRMCEGAGIDALWTRDEHPAEHLRMEAWTAITLAAGETRVPAVGAAVSIELRPPETLAAMATTLDVASGGRLELTFTDRKHEDAEALERYVVAVRDGLERPAVGASGPDMAGSRAGPDVSVARLSVEVTDSESAGVAARVGDDAVIASALGRDVRSLIRSIRQACEESDRSSHTIGIALELPVSIGRTTAEANARAESERLFDTLGQPSDVGVFGTLERCQERVIEFAHAGVTDLRCVVPNSPDIHDVIAQLTAIVVGTVDVLTPDAPRSKAPDPPATWGGRAVPS